MKTTISPFPIHLDTEGLIKTLQTNQIQREHVSAMHIHFHILRNSAVLQIHKRLIQIMNKVLSNQFLFNIFLFALQNRTLKLFSAAKQQNYALYHI
jgi:hypothetical protein